MATLVSVGIAIIIIKIYGGEISKMAIVATLITPIVTATPFSFFILRLVYDLEEAEKKSKELANIDVLTGIRNRRFFLEFATRELEIAKRYGVEFSILVMDVDKLKPINDKYGHMVGDKVLCAIADTCRQGIRKTDVLARLGGDEFVILIPQSEQVDIGGYQSRLERKIHEISIPLDSDELHVSVSMGMVRYAEGMATIDEILSLADKEMYKSKK